MRASKAQTATSEGSPSAPTIRSFRLGSEEFAVIPIAVGTDRLGRLSKAEREIVQWVLRGLGDRAIAEQRGTSPRTVAAQLRTLYLRLGVASRAELIALALTPGPPPEHADETDP